MFQVKAKETEQNQKAANDQKIKLNLLVSLRPLQSFGILYGYFFGGIMKIVLQQGGAKNKAIKAE